MPQPSVFAPLIERAASAIDSGMNVLITGHPGSGLYAIADEVSARLSESRRVVAIGGVKAWQHLPFSTLSTTRADVRALEPGGQPTPVQLRAAVDELSKEVGPTGVMVATHPEWADAASLGVAAQASGQFGHPVVVIADSLSVASSVVPLLHSLRPGLSLTIPPLTFDQVMQLARTRLGGPVEIETVARIRSNSGGLYGVVQGIIDIGRNSGAIAQVGGVWRATRELIDSEVGTYSKYLISGLSAQQLGFLHAIASASIGGEEYQPTAQQLAELPVLSEAGFVEEEGGRLMVYPPLLENYIRGNEQLLRRARVAQLMASGGLGDEGDEDAEATSGRRIHPPAPILSTPETSPGNLSQRIRSDFRTTVTRLRSSWLDGRSAEDALPLVIALLGSAESQELIEDVVARTEPEPASRRYAMLRLWWATYLTLRVGDSDRGFAELAADRERLPDFRALFQAAETHLRMLRGERVPDQEEIADDPAVDFGLGRVSRVDAMLFRGATTDAVHLAADREGVAPVFAEQLSMSGIVALMFDGQIQEGLDHAAAALRAAERRHHLGLIQAWSYIVILGLLLRGRVGGARRALERILTISTSRGLHAQFLLGSVDIGVFIATLSGNQDAAQRFAHVVPEVPPVIGPLPGMGAGAGRVQRGDWGAERILDAALASLENRQLISAAFLIMFANREQQPAADIAAAVAAAIAEVQSPLLRAVGDYLVADAAGDAARLLEIGERFHDLDVALLAVAARSRAAAHRFEQGDRASAFRVAHITWASSAELGSVRVGLFAPLSNLIGLSPRELEVIHAGASGLSNRDIAESLGLSQRTIENHLRSAYQKMGTSDRAEVARASTAWLRAAGGADTEASSSATAASGSPPRAAPQPP